MEEVHLLLKPAAGPARIRVLYRSPLENVQNFGKGGYVRNLPDNVFEAVSCFIETFRTIISRLGAFKIGK